MYEGAPNYPEPDRFWQIVEKYGVTILYTAPTAIRAFMKWGVEWPKKHDLSSLRLLGTVGEPINPEAWIWYHEVIGGKRCPDRRYLVANGNRRHHDHSAARSNADQTRQRDAAVLWRLAGSRGRQRKRRCRRIPAANSLFASPGRACCAGSGAIQNVSRKFIGAR